MADTPGNDVLSQDELDALMESVQTEGADQSAAAAPPADMSATAAEINADDLVSAEPDPVGATLKMESFADLPAKTVNPLHSFERIEDVPLELTVELGRTKLLIKDVLDLGAGSIVELEKMAGEPVDLLANGLLIARGEVVVIDDNFGVRITEIITSAERKAFDQESEGLQAA